ncbi:hypothetical protein DPMN_009328 [Dreissena polymorpha]|uniref:Uncharacterized protein n=1 Tax=Dreissena polymorpha TaxID=45954 RepID=A0A9D4N118_DREPO|nr:hypothetical protein DPMN_009328 [Dreissena polymorpha]
MGSLVSLAQTPEDTSWAWGVGSWPRTLGQTLNGPYPQGMASLTLGLQTSLRRGLDYLIHKVSC